jgi:hypothetical protein
LKILGECVDIVNGIRTADGCGDKNIENIYAAVRINAADYSVSPRLKQATNGGVPPIILDGRFTEQIEMPTVASSKAPPIFAAASRKTTKAELKYKKSKSKSIPLAEEPVEVWVANEEPIAVRDSGAAKDMLFVMQMSKHPDEKFRHWAMYNSGIGFTDIAKSENPKWVEEYGQDEAQRLWASEANKIRMQVRSVEKMLEKREQS